VSQSRLAEFTSSAEPLRTEFPKIDGADMAAVFCGKRVAGDFYDAIRVSPRRILFVLLDIAGRRESNRGILTSVQKIFRTLGADLFAAPDLNESEAMSELCHLLNRGILETAEAVRACPAFTGCYREDVGTLCYTNAGHTPGLVRDGTDVLELGSTGLPLGLFSHATIDSPTVGLPRGSALLLVSRGVIEAEGKLAKVEDLQLGVDRVKERLKNTPSHDAREVCIAIVGPVEDCLTDEDRTSFVLARQV
jgi:sigma-B regulation protein RsbU (phosphoserine phosphatase)